MAHAARTLPRTTSSPPSASTRSCPATRCGSSWPRSSSGWSPSARATPPSRLLVPAALLDDPRPMGEGRHVAFSLAAGGARSRCVRSARAAAAGRARRAGRRRRAAGAQPLQRHRRAAPGPALRPARGAAADRGDRRARRLARPALDRAELDAPTWGLAPAGRSRRSDRAASLRAPRLRGNGIAGLLADLVATGEPVLVVAAARAAPRTARCSGRVGGFAVTSWAALEDDPRAGPGFPHVVALDPPAHAHRRVLLEQLPGAGWTHMAWGEPELGFARRIHEWDYALRAPLAAVYRALREAGGASGEASRRCSAGTARSRGPRRSPDGWCGSSPSWASWSSSARGRPCGGRAARAHRARALGGLPGLPAAT